MADELINLIEFAQGLTDPVSSGMIEQFAREADVLSVMGFKSVTQGVNRFDRETAIPSVGFRAINSEPEISYGDEETFQDACYPISGLIEFDRIKLKRYGERKRAVYMMGQMKAGSRTWTDTFINGDNKSDPKEFDGLKKRLVADNAGTVDGSTDDSRLLANATGSGGGALSLAMLDKAVSLVNNPTHIMMSRDLNVKMQAAARSPSISNNQITMDMDSNLGRRVTRFGDLPILTGYQPSKGSSFLPYDEVAYGGGSAVTTSVYVLSLREDGVCGIQTSAPEFEPVDTDRGVFKRDLFEWDCGITIEDFYSALRLSSISNAAITA
ncbi:major capsid protein [Pseudooceanicola nitratireducens]|uniref:major capsid protein n=1 Tax=Pseudooceanicola nitratireducens TaxID=517719 RepID=UPI003C7E6384